jgi:MoaA/NifB/PqqE/SkfB family radical SAM enzyme
MEILKICKFYDVNVMLLTNGLLISENLIQDLLPFKSQIARAQVSIDGPDAETHEFSRGVKNTWEKTLYGASLFSKYGFPLRVASTINANSIEKIPQLIDLAIYLNAKDIVIGKVLHTGNAVKNRELFDWDIRSIDRYWTIMKEQILAKSNFITILPGMEPQLQLRLSYIEPNFAVVVRPNGDVKIGCAAPFVIGNLRKSKLKEIWEAKGKAAYQIPEVESYINNIKTVFDEALANEKLNIPEGEDSIQI